jgi:hypothetical protein
MVTGGLAGELGLQKKALKACNKKLVKREQFIYQMLARAHDRLTHATVFM